ncbi:MAG TPA: PEP-CTERM sorting domain-containing protein [Verrucomicrobiae bacterium]|nr:PEP-CTERM sorting domain-containing protein [Verrucomicrobiae bacterium]
MRTYAATIIAFLILTGLLTAPESGFAQVYSGNIVGYINQSIAAGNNLIANQLSNSNNTLGVLFAQTTPEGTTFTKWDAANNQYLPASTYDTTGGWSIDYSLNYGEGGLLNSPTSFNNVFVGSVWPGFTGDPFTPPLVSDTGVLLLACVIPINNASFYDVVGRDPADGEFVTVLNPLTQLESTTTYDDGSWDNGNPALAMGQAAFFGLGDPAAITPVPEPSTNALFGAGLAALAGGWRFRRRNREFNQAKMADCSLT